MSFTIEDIKKNGFLIPVSSLLLTRLDFFYIFKNQTIKISIWLSDPPTPLIDMTAMIGFSEMDLDPRKEEETIANHI